MSKLKKEELLEWFVNYINTRAIPLDHIKKLEQIVALIKKPEVTEEWIEEKAKQIVEEIGYRIEDEYLNVHLERVKDFIRKLVEEIGK